jgi:hypothetical protein
LSEVEFSSLLQLLKGGAGAVSAAYTETGIETWGVLAKILNSGRSVIAKGVISALGSSAGSNIIKSINSWGKKFTNPTELYEQLNTLSIVR